MAANAAPIRACAEADLATILEIVNDAAEAYRLVIPPDCWHEPYMSMSDLRNDVAAGVKFSEYVVDGQLVGVMGMQSVKDVDLIRHAYVRSNLRRGGIGGALIQHLLEASDRPMLVGTWAAATWAIEFYRRHGFKLVSTAETPALLRRYWTISDRQIETSVVLSLR